MHACLALAMVPVTATLVAGRRGYTPGTLTAWAPSMRCASMQCWLSNQLEQLGAVCADPSFAGVHECWFLARSVGTSVALRIAIPVLLAQLPGSGVTITFIGVGLLPGVDSRWG